MTLSDPQTNDKIKIISEVKFYIGTGTSTGMPEKKINLTYDSWMKGFPVDPGFFIRMEILLL